MTPRVALWVGFFWLFTTGVTKIFVALSSFSTHGNNSSWSRRDIAERHEAVLIEIPTTSWRLDENVTVTFNFEIKNSSDPRYSYWPEVPRQHYSDLIRAFEPWSSSMNGSWCEYDSHKFSSDTPAGILFPKVPKAASSTLSGIIMRISYHYGRRQGVHRCYTKHQHVDATKYHRRDASKSFLMGNVRDIAPRALSHLYFQHSANQLDERYYKDEATLSSDQVMELLSTDPHTPWCFPDDANLDLGFQLGYLNTEHVSQIPVVMNLTLVQSRVQQVIQSYDFIAVAERMDESLVVLQFLLGLDPQDLLYLPSKVKGSYIPVNGDKQCKRISNPGVTSPELEKFLSSEVWYVQNYGDYLLYKAANASLDRTIESLGRPTFEAALHEYQRLLRKAQRECRDTAIFPCSIDGNIQIHVSRNNCYSNDWGCGYPCLDKIA